MLNKTKLVNTLMIRLATYFSIKHRLYTIYGTFKHFGSLRLHSLKPIHFS